MESFLGSSFMAVFAVSGSVVLLSMQVHKRLLSNFMKKIEFEINNSSGMTVKDNNDDEPKKKVRFADGDAPAEMRGAGKKYKENNNDENLEGMPQNWQVMYKGILQYRNLKGSI